MSSTKPQINGANPFLLGQSPEQSHNYIKNNSGELYQLYLDNVNPNFTPFEFAHLHKHTKRVIAKSIAQNNAHFLDNSRTAEVKKKRKAELRKFLIQLLQCDSRNIYGWIG